MILAELRKISVRLGLGPGRRMITLILPICNWSLAAGQRLLMCCLITSSCYGVSVSCRHLALRPRLTCCRGGKRHQYHW